jgi:hypothetical protein
MIRGITMTEEGMPIQRLAVTTKIAIGLPPDPKDGKKGHPTKLDHFIFLKKSATEQNKWEIDQELTTLFGSKCKSIEIVLLDDDIESVFPTKLAWFTQSACKCFGNGDVATRRTDAHPEGEAWQPCGPACPDLANGDCKPSGDLRFMLAAIPKLGSVVRIHTSSIRSIQQISSSLQQIQTLLGGRLAGIRCNLVVRPEKTSYLGEDGKRHSTTIHAMNLEIQSNGIHALISKMTDHARLFEQTKKILGTGRIEIIEEDTERAPEIAYEFYPASAIAPASVKFPEPEVEDEIVERQPSPNYSVPCKRCGGVNGHADNCGAEQKSAPAEVPAMCSECREVGGKHKADCFYAEKVAAKNGEAAPVVNPKPVGTVYAVHGAEKKTSKKKGEYVVASVVTMENKKGLLYSWHKTANERLLAVTYEKPLMMLAEVSEQKEGDKTFVQIDKLLELGGTVFADQELASPEGLFGEA